MGGVSVALGHNISAGDRGDSEPGAAAAFQPAAAEEDETPK